MWTKISVWGGISVFSHRENGKVMAERPDTFPIAWTGECHGRKLDQEDMKCNGVEQPEGVTGASGAKAPSF